MSTACYSSNEARELLATAGLRTIDDAFRIGHPLGGIRMLKGSRHAHKEVVTELINNAEGNGRIYIKRQWRRERFLPRWTDVRRGCRSSPIAEWRGLTRVREAGVLAAEPLALFRQSRLSARSAIITRAVPANYSLNEMLDLGVVRALLPAQVRSLSQAVVQTICQLQSAGFGWRSMKAKHFYPELADANTWRVWLIDCEGVDPYASGRIQAKDRSRFMASLHQTEGDHGLYSALRVHLVNALSQRGSTAPPMQKREAGHKPLHVPKCGL